MTAGTGIDYKSAKVGTAEYKFLPLSPDVAIDFCTDAIVALSPVLTSVEIGDGSIGAFIMRVVPNIGLINPDKLKKMLFVVRGQMILPNDKVASDEVAFQEWFQKNPSHLLESHIKGLFALVKDFFPQGLGTILAGTSLKNS